MFIFVSLGFLSAQVRIPGALARVQSAAVTIETYDSLGQPLSLGAGFFCQGSGEVITARHVVSEAYSVVVRTSEGRIYEVKEVASEDREWDIVKLGVDAVVSEVMSPDSLEVLPGEAVVILGPQVGFDGKGVREGSISGVREIQGFGKIIELEAALAPGFSGSPVVDIAGHLVGVVTFEVAGDRTVYYAVPAQRITTMSADMSGSFEEWKSHIEKESDERKDVLYIEGIARLRSDDWEAALNLFTEVVSLSPLYVVAYPMIGYCNLKLQRWDDAIKAYYQALLVNPEDAVAYNNISVAYRKLERWGEAMATARQAVRLAPHDAGYRCGLGIAYCKLGEWERSRESFQEAVRLDPKCAAAHYGVGLSSWALNDMQIAWNSYYVLLELDTELAEGLRLYLEQ